MKGDNKMDLEIIIGNVRDEFEEIERLYRTGESNDSLINEIEIVKKRLDILKLEIEINSLKRTLNNCVLISIEDGKVLSEIVNDYCLMNGDIIEQKTYEEYVELIGKLKIE